MAIKVYRVLPAAPGRCERLQGAARRCKALPWTWDLLSRLQREQGACRACAACCALMNRKPARVRLLSRANQGAARQHIAFLAQAPVLTAKTDQDLALGSGRHRDQLDEPGSRWTVRSARAVAAAFQASSGYAQPLISFISLLAKDSISSKHRLATILLFVTEQQTCN
jgi:hypothetical protein